MAAKGLTINDFEVLLCTTTEQLQQAYQVRVDVFHHEQKFPLDTEIDQ